MGRTIAKIEKGEDNGFAYNYCAPKSGEVKGLVFILHGDKLTKYLDGGSALHANLEEHLSKEQYLKMLEVAIKTGCSYFTFNIPNTACNDCGYISKHKLTKCPKCGSENLDYITRVIGYMKRISSFSEARQKEEKQRYYDKAKV